LIKKIAPSILSADFACLGDEIQAVAAAGADWIHVDVMDGCFVPNITMGPLVVKAVRRITELEIDVHLMIQHPDPYIPEFIQAGANWVAVHAEACPHLNRSLNLITQHGAHAGVALNPSTPPSVLEWVLDDIDYVIVMSVNPGFGGQSFIPGSLDKIHCLRRMLDAHRPDILIQVDGSVNPETIASISAAGANVFVAGSAIFGTSNYNQTIATLKQRAVG